MYQLVVTARFKKDLKKVKKNPKNYALTKDVLKSLKKKGVTGIGKKMRPHRLSGRYKDNWECHI